VYWITEPVAHAVTAVIGCFLFWALNVTSFSIAYSGFANPAPWFVFGALLIGQATSSTGLAKRLSLLIMVRLGTSYTCLLFGMLSILLLLQFLVPSGNAQIAILAPVLIHLINAFGVPPTSNIAKGCFLIVVCASVLIGKMFLNSAPAILVRGIIEYQAGLNLMWSQWFIACLPLSLVTLFTCWTASLWLFPPERRVLPGGSESLHQALRAMGPWTTPERKALGWIVLAILLWTTDFVHHTHPALIALGTGLILTLPHVGVLDTTAFKSINFLVIIFLAGAASLSNVLIETNTLNFLAVALSQWALPLFSEPLSSVMTTYGGGFLYHLMMPSETPMIATGLPLLLQMTAPFGDNPIAIGILWAVTSGSCLFVYQSSILVLGYSYGYFTSRDLLKVGAILTVLQGFFIILLVLFYWPAIGLAR
jgi:anion transporter